ncbi:MAG TPA: zf-HC2 domain-containing protein [Gaiellaceae bacterium]|nr:zf-HC2 domain-containing protein [Gaiellaceae bacterium]
MTVYAEQLSCQELVELVTEYLEGALPEEEAGRFESHIGTCNGCRIYLEQMRQTIVVLGHLPDGALAPEAESALLDAFRGWRSS